MEFSQIDFVQIPENKKIQELIEKVVHTCYQEERIQKQKLVTHIVLTTQEEVQGYNKQYRNIDQATDVLSFPMFEREQMEEKKGKESQYEDILGDIIISIPQVELQAKEYGHSFERELAYMMVHGFYHLMGYDHMEEKDQLEMRSKEETILTKLNIGRE